MYPTRWQYSLQENATECRKWDGGTPVRTPEVRFIAAVPEILLGDAPDCA